MTTETNPLRLVGNKAPAWKADAVVGSDFKQLSSDDFKGKWKVLFFYPLDFTFVCPTEIVAYSEAMEQFKALGAEVLACSIDSKFSHLAWTKTSRNEGGIGEVNFPILADTTKKIATDFGVLIEDAGVSLRGLFIIDDNDVIQHATINNLSVGRNPSETLRLLEAYQFTAKHGDVCPAGWTSGSDSMKPDVTGSKEWFGKHAK
jgi:alkyl hydroperoxide reductase subunit AhpC